MKNVIYVLALSVTVLLFQGCATPQPQNAENSENLTVGKVQREIHIGMSSAEVVQALGSPNIVTTDENRNEVWVYDRIASDVSASSSSGGVWLLIIGASSSSSKSSTSQKTLTIVIKFDENKKVRDFSYHTSRF